MKFEAYIGLEVHIQLLTKTKAFCSCKAAFGEEPNTNICPICLAYPGSLPLLNNEGIRMAYLVAKALNCKLSKKTWFERKHYFYPDMPKGYQISQFASPVGTEGYMNITSDGANGERAEKRIAIKDCHFEEDSGKMLHTGRLSYIDYNRAGLALVEIVTEPVFKNGKEAEVFLQYLRRTVRYLGVCNGNMEEGSLRCDANVSVNFTGSNLGTKVEIKNLNSSRHVRLGLDYEITRQINALEKGEAIKAETRLWNDSLSKTEVLREKSEHSNYRFLPEPDIAPFEPDISFFDRLAASIVELPYEREKRLRHELGLSQTQAVSICEEKAFADFYEDCVSELMNLGISKAKAGEKAELWLAGETRKALKEKKLGLDSVYSLGISPSQIASIIAMTIDGRASNKAARLVFEACIESGGEPESILEEKGLAQISDPETIQTAVKQAFASEKNALEDLLEAVKKADSSKTNSISAYLVGKAIALTGGRADPKLVRDEVQRAIKKIM